jgi:hypothetical protein
MQDLISVLPDRVFVQRSLITDWRFQIDCCARDAVGCAVVQFKATTMRIAFFVDPSSTRALQSPLTKWGKHNAR